MNKLVFGIVFAVIVLLARLDVSPAYACTPTPSGQEPPTIARRVELADGVFIGTVTEVLNPQSFEPSAIVQVEQYLKGDGAEQVEVLGFGDGALCRRSVMVDERLIFYVQQRGDGSLYAHWLTAGGAVASPTDELVAEIETAVGLSPNIATPLSPAQAVTETPVPVAETAVSPSNTSATPSSLLVTGISVLLLLIVLVTAVFWRRNRVV